MKTLVAIDSSELLHNGRFNFLKTNKNIGEYFLEYINNIRNSLNPDIIVLCNDKQKSRYRKEVDNEYKEHRRDKSKPLTNKEKEGFTKMNLWRQNLELFEPYLLDGNVINVEADDIMSMLYHDKRLQGYEIIIASGDKDLMGTVPVRNIYVPKNQRGREVSDCFGLSPNRFRQFQAYKGDTTDSLISLKGIGEKTALWLVENFKTFKEVKAFPKKEIDKIKSKRYRDAITLIQSEEGWETLKTVYEIVSLFRDTSKLNEEEELEYNNLVQKILDYERPNEFVLSEDLENFCLDEATLKVPKLLEQIHQFM